MRLISEYIESSGPIPCVRIITREIDGRTWYIPQRCVVQCGLGGDLIVRAQEQPPRACWTDHPRVAQEIAVEIAVTEDRYYLLDSYHYLSPGDALMIARCLRLTEELDD
jgi:hypothetical protein